MGNIRKTISYFKRNGFVKTWYAVRERTDRVNQDVLSKEAFQYTGRENLDEATKTKQRERIFTNEYVFSILVPAYETKEAYLVRMIDSVLQQTYGKLELIVADASKSNQVKNVVEKYTDQRIKYVRLTDNKGISANTNEGLQEACGDYVGLLDHDDVLTEDALYEMMCALEEKEYAFLYSDEDKMDSNEKRFYEVHRKPDFNLDLLLSNNYICHFLVMKRELIQSLRFRPERDGAQDYDLVLRAVAFLRAEQGIFNYKDDIAHIPKVLYHWRCHEDSTAANPESKRYAYEAGMMALKDFVEMSQWDATVEHSSHLGFYTVNYQKSIWEVRPEIAAIGGRVIKDGVVTGSPFVKGKPIFTGLHRHYSGYMHRAHLYLDVDELDKRCQKLRPDLNQTLEEAKRMGMLLVYDPAFCVKE